IIACENAIYASSSLKEEVLKYLNKEEVEYLEIYVGFPNCSVDRIVPPGKNENPLDVTVENFYEWNVEKQ
ncbi:mannitol-1-phosphate 5-dehydrogenase, partial [Acinetobacter baumannii]